MVCSVGKQCRVLKRFQITNSPTCGTHQPNMPTPHSLRVPTNRSIARAAGWYLSDLLSLPGLFPGHRFTAGSGGEGGDDRGVGGVAEKLDRTVGHHEL